MAENKRKRLNDKELGSLYLLAETPLVTDRILKSKEYKESDVTSIHESLSNHAPDMAMIALSLSGNMISEAMKQTGDEQLITLGTELKYLCVNTLEEVGRIWIDACRYGIANDDDIHDIVHQSADILCIFSSLFLEIAEYCTPEPNIIRALSGAMMYQSEAHADNARAMINNATVETQKPNKTSMDAIPLPEELQNETYTNNVVTFSLFGDQ